MSDQAFVPREIIWSQDNHPYLVIHMYRNAAFVVDLKKEGLTSPLVILEKDFSNFTKDEDK